MASIPLSGTNIRFLSGIPFANDYKHTRWFDNPTDQLQYFTGKTVVHSMTKANIIHSDRSFIKADKVMDQLYGVNYVMFQNPDYNNKWFFGFVTKLEYNNPANTHVYFEIDVFQTWLFEMNFKPSYVIREHCPLWNPDGTPIINTVDEGLHYGNEYETISVEQYQPYPNTYFLVIVSKSAIHLDNAITPVVNGLPQPLSFYVHPFKVDGAAPPAKVGGLNVDLSNVQDLLKQIYTDDNSVNNVVSLYITEYLGYNVDTSDGIYHFDDTTFGVANIGSAHTLYVESIPSYSSINKDFGNKYSDFRSVKESKLLMYPYTLTILDDFKGNRVTLKNEYIKGSNLTIMVRGSIGTSNKTSYSIPDYLVTETKDFSEIVSLEHSLINNSPNDVPILSEYLSAYLQGNRNSLENQKAGILFNGSIDAMRSTIGTLSTIENPMAGMQGATNFISGIGNTQLQLQALQAKQKDIQNLPPNMVKMGSNTQFDYGNNVVGLYVIKKQITTEYQKKLEDYFNMFGYKINEVKIPNFHTRKYWNYVQTSSCNITGNFNNEDLVELKSIFDNGVILWHTDDIGNFDLENEVI